MRERLINLIDSADEECKHTRDCKICSGYGKGSSCMNYHIADYLLAKGVIVPPCKVGDVVYVNPKIWSGWSAINYDNCFIHSEYFLVADVVSIIKTRKQNLIKLKVYNRTTYTPEYKRYPISSIGKTVFLNREDAERALKGGA